MPDRWLMFTKIFRGVEIGAAAEAIAGLGFDGADLLIRDGWQVTPAAVAQELPRAVARLRQTGLSVPAATCDLTRADDPHAEAIFAACAAEGIALLRLGYYGYDPAVGFEAGVEQAREALRQLADVGRRRGVKPMLQLHGGDQLNCSGAMALRLLEGIPADDLGIYTDPGNMVAQQGTEPWAMHLDMVRDYLCFVGVKNAGWFHADGRWRARWVGLDRGIVPWDRIFTLLRERNYDGPFSLHSHYEDMTLDQALAQTREDIAYARACWGEEQA